MLRSRLRDGFSLPAVLAVIGVVSLIFLVAMTALRSLTSEALSARNRVQFTAEAMSAEALTAYLLTTEPLSPTGINVGGSRNPEDVMTRAEDSQELEIRLDGRPYLTGTGRDTVIELRDQAGMINLATLNSEAMLRLVRRLGLPENSAARVSALYTDYIDQDSLSQPLGAERSRTSGGVYGNSGPPNRNMRTPDEWLSLPGMREGVNPRIWRQLRPSLAMDHVSTAANVNTASADALEILFGATASQAATAKRLRDETPFASFNAFAGATGVPNVISDGIFTFPSGAVVITVREGQSAWTYRSRLKITPNNLERPLWIDQTELTEAPGRARADISNATRLSYAPR